jgi:transposase InsO family protein
VDAWLQSPLDGDVEGNWVPGKRITDRQVNEYKRYRLMHGQEAAAAKAGMSVRTARRLERATSLPSQRAPRTWRTRQDPLAAVWDSEVVPLLSRDAQLNAVTLLEELQRRHPGEYGEAVLRTLQRRVRQWRALHGTEREVYFAQEHPPGRLGLSDFTVADALQVSIGGARFDHRLYQFALAHSGWRHAEVVDGGESFLALSAGLQGALWRLGGVPEEHRTDSLSAAFNNLAESEAFSARYEALCRHYGMRASRCNLGQSHENGSIESRHGSLKTACQATSGVNPLATSGTDPRQG